MLLVIIPRGIYTAAAAGSVVAAHRANEKVHAVCLDGDAVCGRAAPQDLHEGITFIDVSSLMMESTHWVRSNAYIEASGFELCKSEFHALLHNLDHRFDGDTRIE